MALSPSSVLCVSFSVRCFLSPKALLCLCVSPSMALCVSFLPVRLFPCFGRGDRLWFGNSVASFGGGRGGCLERCTSSTLHFKKACIRHRDKLQGGSRPRPHFIVNLIRKLRLRDTLVHFLSAWSLQTSESRSSYPVVKKTRSH